ncbi:MAG: DUF3592 domain-containing protein [Candidatus Thiodiazotropha sp.]|jgi:hypothetical protein
MQLPNEVAIVMLVSFTVFIGVSVIAYGFDIFRSLASLKWAETNGELINFYIEEIDGGEDSGSTYTPVVRYRYTVRGLTYISDKLGFGLCGIGIASISERSLAKVFIEPLPVYYNPSDVGTAILIRGFTLHHFICLLSLISIFGILLYMCSIYL